jgi:hypothetical protein
MEEAEPQQRRRLEPPFLDLSPYPPWQAPSDSSTAQARAAPVGPPRGPLACVMPRGQVHGRCRKAQLPGSAWSRAAAGPGGLLAELLGVATGPVVPPLPVPAIAAGALLAANLVAADPGWLAARTRPAVTLRAE